MRIHSALAFGLAQFSRLREDWLRLSKEAFGHPIGDSVLQQVAEALTRVLRSTDVLTRYGGDEFAIILPETSLEEIATLVNQIAKIRHMFGGCGVLGLCVFGPDNQSEGLRG